MSYTKKIKSELIQIKEKKICCSFSFVCGILSEYSELTEVIVYRTNDAQTANKLLYILNSQIPAVETSFAVQSLNGIDTFEITVASERILNTVKSFTGIERKTCERCLHSFIRGIFYQVGTISSPSGRFHLEMNFKKRENAEMIQKLLAQCGIEMKNLRRGKRYIIYIKNSEQIEDFLYFINAFKHSYEFMEEKVIRDLRNNINRRSNFEGANMNKSSFAAAVQIEAINKLIVSGKFDSLSDDLKQTARLRLENIDMTLGEIAEISQPKLTKSGLNHRLKKIMELSQGI